MDWRTDDDFGIGQAVQLTSDTGYFWFFDADNVEMIVKAIDACSFRGFSWVFAGGLTNVEATLEVTDTWTGDVRIYQNPLETQFQPIQDTQAFSGCDALEVTSGVPAGDPPPQGQESLFLNDGRFEVQANWTRLDGTSGTGKGVMLTPDTGYFWFFEPENIELVIKVIDACSFRGRFWVFAGGLTNVEVELTVTDTQTGESVPYFNPQQTPFQPIQDTRAFETCP
jgi:hypothetical protein